MYEKAKDVNRKGNFEKQNKARRHTLSDFQNYSEQDSEVAMKVQNTLNREKQPRESPDVWS